MGYSVCVVTVALLASQNIEHSTFRCTIMSIIADPTWGELAWDFANVATITCVASYLEAWFKCLASLHFLYLQTMWARWLPEQYHPTQSTSWSHIIHFSRQFCELSPCVGAPHINLQSKTWNISKSKQHYYLLVKIYKYKIIINMKLHYLAIIAVTSIAANIGTVSASVSIDYLVGCSYDVYLYHW